MDEVSLHSLLSLEKALFQCRRQGDVVSQPDTMEVIDAHTHECSPDVMKFYWNINATIEDLLLKDITEAKFRLRHAVINNNLLFVVIFLRHTGEVDAMDENKQSLLHWSTTAEMVNLLLSYGANIHHLAVSGRTALHSCSTVQATEALLLAGLSPHVLNQNHGSPLHNGFISSGVTRMLLKHGADPNTVNYYGHTPLHVVASRGSWEVVYYLLCGGCDCSVVGRDGMSALSLARMVQSDVLGGGKRDAICVPREEVVRLDKTIDLLTRWQECLQQGKTFAQTKYQVSKHLSWQAQALLCKDPLGGYREAMQNKVPEDVINEVIVHFVGPEGSRVNSYSKFNKMASFRLQKKPEAPLWAFLRSSQQDLAAAWLTHPSRWSCGLVVAIAVVIVGGGVTLLLQ